MGFLGSDLRSASIRVGAIFAIVCTLVTAHALGLLEFVERPLQDLRFRFPRQKASGEVVLVTIDSKTLEALGSWPFSDRRYAEAIDSLTRAGARQIALTVSFPRSAPHPADRRALEETLESTAGAVVLPGLHVRDDGGSDADRDGERLPPEALRAWTTLASADLLRDPDGMVRRYVLDGELGGKAVASLAASMAGGAALPAGTFYIDVATDPDSLPRVSFSDVIGGKYERSLILGKAVLIGVTAPELAGEVALAAQGPAPPVLVHALALDSLVRGRALVRTGFFTTLALTLALGLGLYVRPTTLNLLGRVVVVLGGAALCILVAAAVQWLFPIVLDVAPCLILLLAYAAPAAAAATPKTEDSASKSAPRPRPTPRTEQQIRQVMDNSFDAVIQMSAEGVIELFNEAAQLMFGYSSTEAVGRFAGDFVRHAHGTVATKSSADALYSGPTIREATGVRRDGSRFPVELRVIEIDLIGSKRRVATLRDITDRKAHERALEHQARHDALTGLPNRVMLREHVVRALSQAQRDESQVGFLILDLDRFKEVNDTLGHHVGDMLLKQIGERLRAALRQSDTIARMGGDEFAVLLPKTDADTAQDIARRLVASLSESFDMQGLSLQIEASVGIAMFPGDGQDATDVIQRADVAMYVAKRERTGFAVYETQRDYNSIRHLTLNGELRKAIDEDHLILYYQPKISAGEGRIVGAEALVRWQHALFGLIPPDDFIALAEHSGLIKPLTQWVLNEAMRQTAEWSRKGFPIQIAVNVSARNILEKGMPGEIADLLARNNLPPQQLICEITESVIMEDRRRALEVVTELVRLGVTIAIDDFGTGYSSLAYLRQLPAGEIKIDKSFVMKMDRDKDDAVIVGSTIQMAHTLGLKVVAEGVENERIWSELLALGCDYGQGYFFSRPVPPESFFDLLRSSGDLSPYAPLMKAPG